MYYCGLRPKCVFDSLIIVGTVGIAIVLLAACGAEKQNNAPASPSPIPLITGIAPTLPPTWTPVPSLTPSQSPTPSLTPSLTLTPSPTATFSAEAICENFALTGKPVPGASIVYLGGAGFSWENAPAGSVVVISMVSTASGEEKLFQFASDLGFNAVVSMDDLPGWGTYNWKVSLIVDPYGELCPQGGQLYREPWWLKPIENPLAPPFEGGN